MFIFLFIKIPLYIFNIIKTCFALLSHSDKNKKLSEETIENIQIETNESNSIEDIPLKETNNNYEENIENIETIHVETTEDNSTENIPIKDIEEKNEETIHIKNIEKIGEIESDTKVIIYTPKYDDEKNNINYNTFCAFKSIDDIFYLVYINTEYIIFYNLIDERKVIDICTGLFDIIEIKYLFDEINERDLLISLSENSYLKLWNINNFQCLFDIKININIGYYDIADGYNHLGIIKLNNKNYNILVFNKKEGIKIFDFNGHILNENYRNDLKKIKNDFNISHLIFMDT